MIKLSRERAQPPVGDKFTGDGKAELEKLLMEDRRKLKKGTITKQKFKSSIWRETKDQLKEESHGKCAYCEAKFDSVAFGDVEHYRPKSVYWWLAYNYENYLASCQICNQSFKSDKFPISSRKLKGPRISKNSTDQFIQNKQGKISPDPLNQSEVVQYELDHQAEQPGLINPYIQDPQMVFAWEADDDNATVKLVPIEGDADSTELVKQAIKVYGLNRRELREERYDRYDTFVIFKMTIEDMGTSAALRTRVQQKIDQMLSDQGEFAGMIRFFDL